MNTHSSPMRFSQARYFLALTLLLALPVTAGAQESTSTETTTAQNPSSPSETERAKPAPIKISNFRPHDTRGLNVFEAPKEEGSEPVIVRPHTVVMSVGVRKST